jgi:hypothetical protein
VEPRWLRLAPALAVATHVGTRALFVARGRFFACEDDPYRLYQAVLASQDAHQLIGRFWLPGPVALHALAMGAGVPPAWAGLVMSTLALVVLAGALASLVRRMGGGATGVTAVWVLLFVSPMTLALAHSALAEVPAMALVAVAAASLGRGRAALGGGALALAAATWCRYETWLLVPVLSAAAYRLARPRGARAALADAAIAALAGAGPVAWMAIQEARYGDAFTFLHETRAVLAALAPAPDRLGMLLARALALATWAPVVVVLAATRARGAPRGALAFAAAAALLLVPALLDGREHPVFPARFAWPLEIGLVPLAALGVAGLDARAAPARGRRIMAAALALALVLAPTAALRPAAMLDGDSVRAGLALRAGAHDAALAGGALLVERPERRPPFGWASVGVLWARWDRTVWGEPHAGGWELVEPSDPRLRARVPDAELAAFFARRHVRGAWTVSPDARARLRAVWPTATEVPLGAGAFLFAFAPATK